MTDQEIIERRLANQQIGKTSFETPQDIVSCMVAMQAQEYAMAKWALGLRLPGLKDADVEKAFNDGKILRTHLMRPTWHFVTPADIRWLLALTAPRVNQAIASYYRKYELDEEVFKSSQEVLVQALQGGSHLPRTALKDRLGQEGIRTDTIRMSFIMMRAELDAVICSGPRTGKQFTYALLEERVPKTETLTHDEALVQFTRRYFESRGPATLKDFSYWSGLTMKDVRIGMDMVQSRFDKVTVDGETFYFPPGLPPEGKTLQKTFLLPDYDEYIMSYRDRGILNRPGSAIPLNGQGYPLSNHFFVIGGQLGGFWEIPGKGRSREIPLSPFACTDPDEKQELDEAVKRYQAFREV